MNCSLTGRTLVMSLMTILTSVLTGMSAAAAETEENQETKRAEAPAKASAAVKSAELQEWTVQLRGGLGGGRVAGEKDLKSDRLGVGLYGGKRLSDFELSLPFLKVKNTSAGVAYQTFTGVDANADRSWSVQSLGGQLRVDVSPFADNVMDLALQGGASLQRMVAQEPVRLGESVKYGFALTAGGYLRTLAFDGVYAIGGADVLLGSGSWFGLTLGLESHF